MLQLDKLEVIAAIYAASIVARPVDASVGSVEACALSCPLSNMAPTHNKAVLANS